MSRNVGLRTEILLNLAILLGAALLFAGFLLLKLTEKELLTQRVTGARDLVQALAGSAATANSGIAGGAAQIRAALLPLTRAEDIEAWLLLDASLRPVASFNPTAMPAVGAADRLRFFSEPLVTVDYASQWLPWQPSGAGSATIAVALRRQGEFVGALQVRFALEGIRQRVASARELVLWYVAMYGTILVAFGLYLLGRNVVRPIGRLRRLTGEVAGGNLDVTLAVAGPREIADLTASFNAMIAALRQSRAETLGHIAALQQAGDELIRSEKMASVGHLAAGMAHEIGNPLGAIVGYLELLKAELTDGEQRDLADRSLVEVGRIDRLVRDLLDFAAPAPCSQELFDPVVVAVEALELLKNQGVFDHRELINELPARLPQVAMVRHRLQQVLINLLLNARDATGAGEEIRMAAGTEADWLWLAVGDAGGGMSPEVQAHLFDPFYTTKVTGRGLGLAICQRIVEESGGRIDVRSAPGRGSEFRVWLRVSYDRQGDELSQTRKTHETDSDYR